MLRTAVCELLGSRSSASLWIILKVNFWFVFLRITLGKVVVQQIFFFSCYSICVHFGKVCAVTWLHNLFLLFEIFALTFFEVCSARDTENWVEFIFASVLGMRHLTLFCIICVLGMRHKKLPSPTLKNNDFVSVRQ